MLSGEPGVGKTRLAAEFARQVHAEGRMVLAGRCDEDLGVPYQPFVEALRQYVDGRPDERCPTSAPHPGTSSAWCPISAGASRSAPAVASDPETERYRLFDAVGGLARGRIERTAPCSWCSTTCTGRPSRPCSLLRHLSVRPSDLRLLVVGTYRATELDHAHPLAELLADLRRRGSRGALAFRGLDAAAVIAFLVAARGPRPRRAGPGAGRRLTAETEGNPFFVREVIRHLTETEKLQRQEGRLGVPGCPPPSWYHPRCPGGRGHAARPPERGDREGPAGGGGRRDGV